MDIQTIAKYQKDFEQHAHKLCFTSAAWTIKVSDESAAKATKFYSADTIPIK